MQLSMRNKNFRVGFGRRGGFKVIYYFVAPPEY